MFKYEIFFIHFDIFSADAKHQIEKFSALLFIDIVL